MPREKMSHSYLCKHKNFRTKTNLQIVISCKNKQTYNQITINNTTIQFFIQIELNNFKYRFKEYQDKINAIFKNN